MKRKDKDINIAGLRKACLLCRESASIDFEGGYISKAYDTFIIHIENSSSYSFSQKIELFKTAYKYLDSFQIFDFEASACKIKAKDGLIKTENMPNIISGLGKRIAVTKRLNKNDFSALKKLSIKLGKEIYYNVLFEPAYFIIDGNTLEIRNNLGGKNFDFLERTFKNIRTS